MATFDLPTFRAATVGLNHSWDQLSTTMRLDDTGPPAYNLLRTGEDDFRISLSVPGFKADEITVETQGGQLWIKGELKVDLDHNRYLYRGIELQSFQRSFELPEHVHVDHAHMAAGLLHIDLRRELPDALRPRRIDVQTDDRTQPVLEQASKAA